LFRKFALRVDKSSIKWLQTLKNPEQQLFRWLAVIQGFDFQIFHRPGKFHGNCDSLSRRPCDVDCKYCTRREEHPTEDIDVVHAYSLNVFASGLEISSNTPWNNNVIREAQRADPQIAPVLAAVQASQSSGSDAKSGPALNTMLSYSASTQYLFRQWDRLHCNKDRVLCRRWFPHKGSSWDQIIVPSSMRQSILAAAHHPVPNSHFKKNKMIAHIRNKYYWPEYSLDVGIVIRNCRGCLRGGNSQRKRAPLQIHNAGYPFQKVCRFVRTVC